MTVRPGRKPVRQSAQTPQVYKTVSIPAPSLGLIANTNLDTPKPGGAYLLENIIPTATGARLRRGSERHAIVSTDESPVVSLFQYVNGNAKYKFAATATDIYDITAPSFADLEFLTDSSGSFLTLPTGEFLITSDPAAATISGFAGGEWSSVQFATSGGVYLRLVNGVDTPLVFDGTSFGTSPAITSLDVSFDPRNLSYTWVHQQRVFFVEKDTLSAWYLPADSIGGAAVELPLAGVFNLGGSLLFGSTWSLETGAGGLSEQCIFVTTEGEVAVYQGADPSTSSTWAKVGIYKIGKPLGPNAHFRAGGDIVIATDIGLIPLSQAIQKDFAVLSPSAVSASIETIWNDEVTLRSGGDWNCIVWSKNQIAIIVPPKLSGQSAVMYAVNTRTGGWAKITGWDATCLLVYEDRLYFGTDDGHILEANVTGLDVAETYTGKYIPLFSDYDMPGYKTSGMSRTVLRAPTPVTDKMSMLAEYSTSLPTPPDATVISQSGTWGTAVWGTDTWGASVEKSTYAVWRSTPNNGNSLAPTFQVTSGSLTPLDIEIIKTEITFIPSDAIA